MGPLNAAFPPRTVIATPPKFESETFAAFFGRRATAWGGWAHLWIRPEADGGWAWGRTGEALPWFDPAVVEPWGGGNGDGPWRSAPDDYTRPGPGASGRVPPGR